MCRNGEMVKTAIIFISSFFVLLLGTIIFFCVINYDKLHFGDELIMYSDAKAEGYPVLVEYQGVHMEILGYDKTELYRILLRGQGTRKRHFFPKKSSEAPIVITYGEEYRITVYPLLQEKDSVLYVYETQGKRGKKYYSVTDMKTWEHLVTLLIS